MTRILPLILVLAFFVSARAEIPDAAKPFAILRGNYQNARIKFEREKKGHVVFLGGSITENAKGHTAMVPAWLQESFPDTEFTFTNAGMSSTCSTTGAFRLAEHVLAVGPVDLLIVEFAVNDDQDAGHAEREALRGLEGIVRHTRAHSANADILQIHFANPGIVETFENGKTPVSVQAHETVAKHYELASVNVGAALAAGAQDWKTYGGTHPKQAGYRLVSDMVISVFETAWKEPLNADAKIAPYELPQLIDAGNYERGKFLDPATAAWMGGWSGGKATRDLLPVGGIRERYESMDLTVGSEPGATMTVDFQGVSIGAFVLAGPDAGILEASVDRGPFKKIDLYHRYSKGLNYPRTVMFYTDLENQFHQLTLRIAKREGDHPGGDRAAILQFVVNQ